MHIYIYIQICLSIPNNLMLTSHLNAIHPYSSSTFSPTLRVVRSSAASPERLSNAIISCPGKWQMDNSNHIQQLHVRYGCVYISIHIYTYVCIYVHMYIYIYMYIHINIDIYMYIYIYIHCHPIMYYLCMYVYIEIVCIYKYISSYHVSITMLN